MRTPLPADYRAATLPGWHDHPDGVPSLPDRNVEEGLGMMDWSGIATAMQSIPSRRAAGGDATVQSWRDRRMNGGALVCGHPGRFGLFAASLLPNVLGDVHEAAPALDERGADGVMTESSHAGLHSGAPALDLPMVELDRRGAVVFLRPISTACAGFPPVQP